MLPLVLIKQQALTSQDSHFAGGVHLFASAAATLSDTNDVHVVTTARKSLLLHHAVQHSLLRQLMAWRAPHGTEASSWVGGGGVTWHAAVLPDEDPAATTSAAALLDVLAGVLSTKLQQPQQASAVPLLLDADSMQQVQVPAGVAAGAGHQQQQQPFMAALMQTLQPAGAAAGAGHEQQQQPRLPPTRLLVLVQNVHHLPFGAQGSAPRSAAVLQAWRRVQGIVCVSRFISDYLQQHAVPLLGLDPGQQLHVVHPAAFGVWGRGAFKDLGAAAAARLWPTAEQQQASEEQQQQQAPAVGVLKLTREKGADLLFALCRKLPHLQFVAVAAGDCTGLQEQVAAAGLQNVRLVEPVADVAAVLQSMSLVLVPSVLHEAFGMVVLDALLHALPVLVSRAGALPEAAAGAAAAVLPVAMVRFPPDADSTNGNSSSTGPQQQQQQQQQQEQAWLAGQRSWGRRVYGRQEEHVQAWADAVSRLLSDREAYVSAGQRGRRAALAAVAGGEQQLQQLVAWLLGLGGGGM